MFHGDMPQEEDGIISPESFRQGLPAWLVSPQQTIESEDSNPSEYSMRLSDTELEILASHGDPEIARIAQCTIDLKLHAVKLDKSNLLFYPQDGLHPGATHCCCCGGIHRIRFGTVLMSTST